MRILLDAGFSRKEAARAYRVLFTYTFGFASFSPPEASAEHRRLSQAALAALPPEQYPALSSAAAEAAASMGDEAVFDYGLDRLLDGLEAGLRQAAD